MACEDIRRSRDIAIMIGKSTPLHTKAATGQCFSSDQLNSAPNASQLPFNSHQDLEKGRCLEAMEAHHSSTTSIATMRSTSSAVPTVKEKDGLPLPANQGRTARFLNRKHCPPQDLRLLMNKDNYTTYRKIFTLIFVVNIAILIAFAVVYNGSPPSSAAANAAGVNLAVGVIFRQEQVVNFLFEVLTSVPHSWPLFIRGNLAKVFHYGGVHSGCGVAAVAWFLLYTALITKTYLELPSDGNLEALISAWVLVALFGILLGGAYPAFRIRYHNLFEVFHRFAGWSALAAFWAHVLFAAHAVGQQTGTPMSAVIVRSVPFWCILLATLPVIGSWAQLRKRAVQVEALSDHATRLRFNHARIDPCMGIRVSTNPILEWHSFATIPNMEFDAHMDLPQTAPALQSPGAKVNFSKPFEQVVVSTTPCRECTQETQGRGFSIVVSNAGDWTKQTIQSPPRALWIRGSPIRGVIYAARLFSRVVVVATGSGIGPCLSLLVAQAQQLPARPRVLWSAPNPLATFGPRILAAVREADPEAVIWDTRAQGRPDLCRLAENLVREANAEAVFCISNPKVCKMVVTELGDRGIRAYAPIFDS